ncbi:hypothetical protein QUW15_11405 [Desulfovibrio piger]|nr:hypothetical protein [Desulfovibrio piger]
MPQLIDRMQPLTDAFDWLHQFWESPTSQKRMAFLTLVIYLVGMIGIEMNRQGWLPEPWAHLAPTNHFDAIQLAFTLILIMEVISLIFSISSSFSRAVGKQFEILALILLRNAFKELSHLPEPISIGTAIEPVVHIATSASGALIIFVALGIYNRIGGSLRFLQAPELRMRFVMSKKLLALLLFCVFVGIGIRDAYLHFMLGQTPRFFETIYTVLVFADIALVLISQRYMPSFHAVFRNSGFVIGTLLMRLSLSATAPWDTAISIFAAVYVLALTWTTSHFAPDKHSS